MGGKVAKPDLRIAEMASEQHGVVSIDQLCRLGLSEKAIARRVDGGLLHRPRNCARRSARRTCAVCQSARGTQGRTRSDLDGDFLRVCRRHRLPPPEVNVRIGSYLVDFLWREKRLVVETDSYLYHRGEAAFQEDHARDLGLIRRGFEVLWISELQLDDEPARVAEVLATRLALESDAAQRGQDDKD